MRRTEKAKYRNNMGGSLFAWLTNGPMRAKIKASKCAGEWQRVLDQAEVALARNPWDVGIQIDMADAAENLGLLDLAIWSVEQARQKNPRDSKTNRVLARLYEKRGNFTQAMALWSVILQNNPADNEAQDKAKDLAASETIARGNYTDAAGNPNLGQYAGRKSNPELNLNPASGEPGRKYARPRPRDDSLGPRGPPGTGSGRNSWRASTPTRPTPTPTSSSQGFTVAPGSSISA